MKFHDFSPFYRSGEGIRSKVAGDRLIDNPAVADAQGGSGASFRFDGGDSISTITQDDIATLGFWVKFGEKSSTNAVMGRPGWSGSNPPDFYISRKTDNKLHVEFASPSQDLASANTISSDEWHHIVLVLVVGSPPKVYIDGVLSVTGSVNTTGLLTGFTLGKDHGGSNSFVGELSLVRAHNHALSAAEVRAAYNGQAVPFEYRGASQDDLITGSSIWADGGGSNIGTVTTNSDNDVTWGQTGAGDTGTNQVNASLGHWILANGTAYRVSFKAKVSSGTATLKHRPWGDDAKDWNLTTSFQDFSFEEVLTAGENNAYFYSTSSSSLTYTIEDYKITQIGCVAEYLPSGVGHGMWLDGSGNELHGSVSGATAIGIGSNHREKYVDLTVTGDTSFALPKGYRVAAITTKETAGNTLGGGMDVGTTNGGGEVVAAHAITASTTAIATIVASGSIGGTHTTADDTLYITDADGTGWDSASVEVRVEMERLIV